MITGGSLLAFSLSALSTAGSLSTFIGLATPRVLQTVTGSLNLAAQSGFFNAVGSWFTSPLGSLNLQGSFFSALSGTVFFSGSGFASGIGTFSLSNGSGQEVMRMAPEPGVSAYLVAAGAALLLGGTRLRSRLRP